MSSIDFRSLSRGIHNTRLQPISHHSFQEGDFAFLRIDRVRLPLEAPYQGPFEIVQLTDKVAKLKLANNKELVVSLDRLKAAKVRKLPTSCSFVSESQAVNTAEKQDSTRQLQVEITAVKPQPQRRVTFAANT